MSTHAHTYTNTRTHTHTYTGTHTCKHMRMHNYTHRHAHTGTHTHTCTHTQAHTHTYVHTYTHVCVRTGPGQIEMSKSQERGRLPPGGLFNDEAVTQSREGGAGLKASLVASAPNTVIIAFTAADVERVAVRACVRACKRAWYTHVWGHE